MSDNVIPIGCITSLDIPVDHILNAAVDQLDSVVLIGWDTEGALYCASSIADGGEVLWLLEKAKQLLLQDE